jgi:hypothetical protein
MPCASVRIRTNFICISIYKRIGRKDLCKKMALGSFRAPFFLEVQQLQEFRSCRVGDSAGSRLDAHNRFPSKEI